MLDLPDRKQRARAVIRVLRKQFPDARCSLDHETPFQLLIATILSAQCTDARVNMVTPDLFKTYPGPADFADAELPAIEDAVRSTGFFKNKAKSIRGACQAIMKNHGGELPRTMPELIKLPGVGRKTANVVLGNAFNQPDGVVVDTHVGRISQKLGLSDQTDAVKCERQLNEAVPRKEWVDFSHLLIHHGRQTCKARKPNCDECPIYKLCEVRA
ncbi:MAG: endonuclease III [bacterium]